MAAGAPTVAGSLKSNDMIRKLGVNGRHLGNDKVEGNGINVIALTQWPLATLPDLDTHCVLRYPLVLGLGLDLPAVQDVRPSGASVLLVDLLDGAGGRMHVPNR